jgi:uncharacterized DUF497 family protein
VIDYTFEWDANKAQSNLRKHGVSFQEARSVFLDRWAVESFDVDHSSGEDRFIIIGMSERERLLTVAYAFPRFTTIRIISARRALTTERRPYEEQSPRR